MKTLSLLCLAAAAFLALPACTAVVRDSTPSSVTTTTERSTMVPAVGTSETHTIRSY